MVMTLQHQINPVFIKKLYPVIQLLVGIASISRTVHRNDFPGFVRAGQILLQPFSLLFQIALRVQYGNMHRTIVEGVRCTGN
ncbi:hypothetical protein D3C72_2019470 [compost metagenome]